MRTRTGPNGSADKYVKKIKRRRRRQFFAEGKIRIVLDGFIGLPETPFGAPIVTGYAAIIGQKFTLNGVKPAAASVVAKLLDTARTNTIFNYSVSVHGQGEASLINALSPDTLPS